MGQPAPGLTVRKARQDDLPRLLELYYQLSQLGSYPESEPQPLTATHAATLTELDQELHQTCLVLEEDGRVMATLCVYILPNLSHGGRPFALVENVVVDASARGNGYGKLLMAEAEARAAAAGCHKVSLTSNKRRVDAHRFYEHLGYTRSHEGMTKGMKNE